MAKLSKINPSTIALGHLADSILSEVDENGDIMSTYTSEPEAFGQMVSQFSSGAHHFYHFDGQGGARQVTLSTGVVADQYAYTGFGEALTSTGTTRNPFRYKGSLGYYFDDFGDYYVRARHYNAGTARFTSRDPIGWADQANGYSYARNSPIVLSDPSGLQPLVRGFVALFQFPELPDPRDIAKGIIEGLKGGAEGIIEGAKELQIEALKALCCEWYNRDKRDGQGWLDNLPDCPCFLDQVDESLWTDPVKMGTHGGMRCIRSKQNPLDILKFQPGQQCCYDNEGKLLTNGANAGTPDKNAPAPNAGIGVQTLSHVYDDVYNYYACKDSGLLALYLERRPPNKGVQCMPNPNPPESFARPTTCDAPGC